MKKLLFAFTLILLDAMSCVGSRHNEHHENVPVELTVSTSNIDLENQQGSSAKFTVHSNIQWTIASERCSWLEVDPLSGEGDATITVTAKSSNESSSGRYCSVYISGNGLIKPVNVCQMGKVPDDK